jgi:myosin heavy subunit
MVRLLMLMLVGLSLSLGACEKREHKAESDNVSSKEVQQKVTEAMQTAADYAKQEKDDYVASVQKEMDEARQDIERLKAKAKTASAKAKVEIDRDIKAAEAKWEVAEQKLHELKAASIESWKNLRAGMDKAVGDVKQRFSKNKKG